MSFAEWRRRARLLRALGWIAEGRPILAVALDLGYDSPSAFSGSGNSKGWSPAVPNTCWVIRKGGLC